MHLWTIIVKNEAQEWTSCSITLAHDIRGGCWWDSSRGWTFSSVSHYMLLLCDRWQQTDRMVSDMEVHVRQAWNWILLCRKSCTHWHSSMFGEHLWRPNSGCGIVRGGWCISTVASDHSAVAGYDEHGMQTLVHHWQKYITNGDDLKKNCFFPNWEFTLSELLCSFYLLKFPWK